MDLTILPGTGAPLTMSSREIADLTGKEHRNVMRDIRALLEELHGADRVLSFEQTVTRPNPSGGTPIPSTVFQLPKRECLILTAGYSTALRARIIDRWMELEQAQAPALPDLSNPALLRDLLLGYTEKVLALESKIEEQAPKVAFADAVASAGNAQPVREVAKVLQVGEKALREFLRRKGIFMQHEPLPTQRYIDQGYFTVVERTFDDGNGFKKNYAKALVTGPGLQFLQRKLAEGGLHGGH